MSDDNQHITRNQLLRRIAELEVTNLELKDKNLELMKEVAELRIDRAQDQHRLFHYERIFNEMGLQTLREAQP